MSEGARAPSRVERWWGARPPIYSRPLWALLRVLDLLPWPWGEDVAASLFAGVAIVRPSRRARAVAWARHFPDRATWRLALGVASYRGRWVARSSGLGVRGPDDLRRHLEIRGVEHLGGEGGRILLGLHLGPPSGDLALLAAGHRAAWLGTKRHAPAWVRPSWTALRSVEPILTPDQVVGFWAPFLYRARAFLLAGGTVFTMADSEIGRRVFEIPVPGRVMTVRGGWLALHRQTGARVVPILAHLEGRAHVLTVHPPLPPLPTGTPDDLAAWRRILSALVTDYVQRFPDQCPVMAFPPTFRPRGGPGASARA